MIAKAGGEMRVVRIARGEGMYVTTFPDTRLRAGDRLLLTDTPQNPKKFEQALGGTLFSGDTEVDENHPPTAEDQRISEIVVVDGSPIEGASLKTVRFMDRYQLVELALHRAGKPIASLGVGMGDVVLEAGDVLLVQGPAEQIAALKKDDQILVLDATTDLPHASKSPTAVLIMAAVILLAAFGGLVLLMGIMTNVVSSNAAAVIGTPIAVSIALQPGQSPEPFVLAVIFGSNLCYATPLAHKINVLVMSAGGYRFSDFVRVGLPLAVIMWVSYTLLFGILYGI